MGQAWVSMINFDSDYDKKGTWSHLKQYYGPLLKTKYLAQFPNEWKKFQDEWPLGLMVCGSNSNSLNKSEIEDGLHSLKLPSGLIISPLEWWYMAKEILNF